jgi:hypothetical protein
MSFTLTLSKTPQTLLDYEPNDEVLYLLLKDERCAAALKTTRDVRQEKLAQPWRSSDSIPSAVTAWMKQLQRFEEPRSRDELPLHTLHTPYNLSHLHAFVLATLTNHS